MDNLYIDYGFKIDTDLFRLEFVPGRLGRAQVSRRAGGVLVALPAGFDTAAPASQAWLRKVLESILREQARALLPPRLAAFAACYGLRYNAVRIKDARTRWGSCSSLGNINLSFWLLFAPGRLVDYVLKHELAHLREMNHGPRFWQVLDGMTGGEARLLEKEMKAFSRTRMSFLSRRTRLVSGGNGSIIPTKGNSF